MNNELEELLTTAMELRRRRDYLRIHGALGSLSVQRLQEEMERAEAMYRDWIEASRRNTR